MPKHKHAFLLNRLAKMQSAYYYASAREDLAAAERLICDQGVQIDALKQTLKEALDWIEQRATTEKDGLLVERLQDALNDKTGSAR